MGEENYTIITPFRNLNKHIKPANSAADAGIETATGGTLKNQRETTKYSLDLDSWKRCSGIFKTYTHHPTQENGTFLEGIREKFQQSNSGLDERLDFTRKA